MSADRSKEQQQQQQWVEIIEPKSKEKMFANLETGSCTWDEPKGVPIKRSSSSQWWELFDPKTDRFYYYNCSSQKTVWHKPQNCDIIPLAKLQILKQNTEPPPNESKDLTPPQQHQLSQQSQQHKRHSDSTSSNKTNSTRRNHDNERERERTSSSGHSKSNNSGYHIQQAKLHSVDDFVVGESYKFCKHSSGGSGSISRNNQKYMDSGKSSDSSLSSNNYRKIQEGGSLRIGSSHGRNSSNNKYNPDSTYRMLQESSSSHNIPERGHKMVPSNSTDLVSSSSNHKSPSHSSGTPLMKKRLQYESNQQTPGKSSSREKSSKHQSFDYSGPSLSITRSGSFMSPVNSGPSGRSQLHQRQQERKGSFDGHGSDDSMHEKYFKSVENTPVSRRRHTTTSKSGLKSSDSSPQSPISPQHQHQQHQQSKSVRPSHLGLESLTKKSSHNNKYDPDIVNMDIAIKQDRFSDKMKMDRNKLSPATSSGHSANNLRSIQQINQMLKPSNTMKSPSSHSQESTMNSLSKANKNSLKSTYERKGVGTSGSMSRSRKKNYTNEEVEYADNGNTSPLYTNWDQDMHEHLLPLQHYILEQAKLSGFRGSNEQYDSDSIRSESPSEHSLSGNEPDVEDSDHSDGRDYLVHNPYEDYGAFRGPSYYNYENYNRNMSREDISAEVTAKLESFQDQIYSPVRHHPPLLKYSYSPVNPHAQSLPKESSAFQPYQPHQQSSTHSFHVQKPHAQQQSSLSYHQQQPQVPPPQSANQHASSLVAARGQSKGFLQRFQDQLNTNSDKIAEMALIKECDIEKFAQENLNFSKGIFRKKSSVRDMLSFTNEALTKPMLSITRDKNGKKMTIEQFKLVQIYMGDRKARIGMSLNSVAMDIITQAVANTWLRDELYVQLCRQTTENPKRESLIRGWELMAICLAFVPPSPTFQPALMGYMNRHRDPSFAKHFPEIGKWPIHVQVSHYATIACRRLERIGSSGKKQAKKPTDEEINHAREQIFRDSMFGNTLQEVMDLQRDIFPDRKIPWIQHTLSEQILLMQGKQTEGIFRVPADVDEVMSLKAYVDKWEFPENRGTMDAHAPASLLKLWYRELYDPLIPDEFYNECIETDDPKEVMAIVDRLPSLNRLVLTYLIHFLQEFAQPEVVANTKMDSSNLAMVFAPNLLRCTSQDPKIILENTRKEMNFIRTLITSMDTSSSAYM
ncbi:hypothetical protein PVAND_003701 [Polypedilum vanderplanki]|uniref:Rho GTPase-activating protein 39 n=1 Tax=Polypedilum vanderplanki TaxID=319348 RepID=A0A9J6BVW3_POLVA|nr:hypothetical protein PVAND_003701 [Polypedilum vanderplanki]